MCVRLHNCSNFMYPVLDTINAVLLSSVCACVSARKPFAADLKGPRTLWIRRVLCRNCLILPFAPNLEMEQGLTVSFVGICTLSF
uniref:Secreted protein n=1 Tax=Mesocestoides corti TaxID=53468 RepID=A0A5K3FYB7_MESCO